MALLVIVAAVVLLWRHFNQVTPQPDTYMAPAAPSQLDQVSQSIANYEGYYKPGSLAQRTNNPGDIGTFGGHISSYPDANAGFAALNNWVTSHASSHPGWDFYDMMRYYLTGDTMGQPGPGQNPDAYAEYVASSLGVEPTTPVSQVIGG